MNLFGRKKAAAATAQDPANTILKLRSTVETLEKRQVHLDKKIEQQTAEAKAKMAKKDKRGALYCLKRKKMRVDPVPPRERDGRRKKKKLGTRRRSRRSTARGSRSSSR